MINDLIKVTGNLDVVLYDAEHRIKRAFSVPNRVVTAGKIVIAGRLIGTSPGVMTHMAVGTDNGSILTLADSNSALGAQIGSRVVLTSSTVSANVVTFTATFGAGVPTGGTLEIVEAGIFNASTDGSMLCRTIFPVINKEPNDVLTINWNVTIN